MTAVILASGSAARAQLLDAAGVTFDVVSPNIDEQTVRESLLAQDVAPPGLAQRLAELKALKVSGKRQGAFVIGADQVLVFHNEAVGKSSTPAEARDLLRRMAGHVHELISAAVLAKDGMVVWRHVARADMHMRKVSDAFLDAYLAKYGDGILHSVGCYQFEGEGAQLFSHTSGDYFTILGLPLLPLLEALRQFGALAT